MNIDNLSPNEILKLLETCDELDFSELIHDLQNHLIKKEKEWVQQNLIYIYDISLKYHSFSLFQNYCGGIICENPKVFLKSDDIKLIEKSMFMSILKTDDLELEEIVMWDCVIQN